MSHPLSVSLVQLGIATKFPQCNFLLGFLNTRLQSSCYITCYLLFFVLRTGQESCSAQTPKQVASPMKLLPFSCSGLILGATNLNPYLRLRTYGYTNYKLNYLLASRSLFSGAMVNFIWSFSRWLMNSSQI